MHYSTLLKGSFSFTTSFVVLLLSFLFVMAILMTNIFSFLFVFLSERESLKMK